MKVVSLFSGAGGADLGFDKEGYNIVFATDIDPDCNRTYNKNFSTVQRPYTVQYVNECVKKGIMNFKGTDVVIGGPPCQSFSMIRVRGKLNCDGLVNVHDMQEFVKNAQPKIFICENVASIFKISMLHIHMDFMIGFQNAGYKVDAYTLNTEDFGIPQTRKRAFYIGVRNDLAESGVKFRIPELTHWNKEYTGWLNYLNSKLGYDKTRMGVYIKRASDVAGRLPEEAAFTITGAERPCIRSIKNSGISRGVQMNTASRMMKGVEQRYLTLDELKALQGFSQDFSFEGGIVSIRKQIGNAWSVPVARALAKQIKLTLS